ncbi:hypothetical protein BANRA_05606 [Klebsiella pneumoniae]|nr:hypothetical protein BANRA_05606 [Klebsiella pneumoniae]
MVFRTSRVSNVFIFSLYRPPAGRRPCYQAAQAGLLWSVTVAGINGIVSVARLSSDFAASCFWLSALVIHSGTQRIFERKCSACSAASFFFISRQPAASQSGLRVPVQCGSHVREKVISRRFPPVTKVKLNGVFHPIQRTLVFTTKFILALYTIYGTGGAESHQCHQGCAIERKEGAVISFRQFSGSRASRRSFSDWMA